MIIMQPQIKATDTTPLPDHKGHALRGDAADAWTRACKSAGFTPELTDSYRPYSIQERIFRDRYRQGNHSGKTGYTTDIRTWNGQPWTRRTGTAAAAIPGTSNHGGGVAVDVRTRRDTNTRPAPSYRVFTSFTDPDRTAFLTTAKDHGWADSEGRAVNEHWHLTYYPELDKWNPNTTGNTSKQIGQNLKQLNLNQTQPAGITIRRLQALLTANGHPVTIDGNAGTATRNAVIGFQKQNKLTADAIVGAATWNALLGI